MNAIMSDMSPLISHALAAVPAGIPTFPEFVSFWERRTKSSMVDEKLFRSKVEMIKLRFNQTGVSAQRCRVEEEGTSHPYLRGDSSQRGVRHHRVGQQHRWTATHPHQAVQGEGERAEEAYSTKDGSL
ncbi:hypothetical protein OJAV_G00216430 [Oryzias javanicus]|uniref:Uncharacterized protein n=1 Tax=Oryzias javanicus TaxID=123683 RepID=A0A437C4E7_ORYJA|nr:hypothetical protein OJAV_G00216430 [Oryzias javanicus]